MAGNRALLPHARPDLILMAERAGDLVGFMFAVPDLLQARRGESVDTIILKTMAVDPSCRAIGSKRRPPDVSGRRITSRTTRVQNAR